MRNRHCDIPEVVPSPPDGWRDEGKLSEYIDRKWIRKPDLGRPDRSEAVIAVQSLLAPFSRELGGTVLWSWHMLAVPDLLRPDVVMTFPKYSVYQGYLVAPAFLTVDVHAKEESIPGLIEKCKEKYHPFGTPYCWIIDIEEHKGYEMHRGTESYIEQKMLAAGPEIQVPVQEIFRQLDKHWKA
jgi:Uma2 family endonuclease